jgi:hypothetical protein
MTLAPHRVSRIRVRKKKFDEQVEQPAGKPSVLRLEVVHDGAGEPPGGDGAVDATIVMFFGCTWFGEFSIAHA